SSTRRKASKSLLLRLISQVESFFIVKVKALHLLCFLTASLGSSLVSSAVTCILSSPPAARAQAVGSATSTARAKVVARNMDGFLLRRIARGAVVCSLRGRGQVATGIR